MKLKLQIDEAVIEYEMERERDATKTLLNLARILHRRGVERGMMDLLGALSKNLPPKLGESRG